MFTLGDLYENRTVVLLLDNLPCPNSVNSLSNEGNPHTCFLVIPPNEDKGKMEDLCLKSVEKDKTMFCIENFFLCLKDEKLTSPEPKDISKAKAQIFMASRRKICSSIGVAAVKKYWNFDHSCFVEVKDFLRLFNTLNRN